MADLVEARAIGREVETKTLRTITSNVDLDVR